MSLSAFIPHLPIPEAVQRPESSTSPSGWVDLSRRPDNSNARSLVNHFASCFTSQETIHPLSPLPTLATYSAYNSNLQTYEVYLRLEDTSKAARRNFNGIARLAPPPFDDDWIRDGDSEADLTGVQPDHTGASLGHSLVDAVQGNSTATGRGADTFRSLLCGTTAAGYFEFDMLSDVDSATKDQILSGIHPTRRA